MDWINIKDKQPTQYQEVIVTSNEGVVKSAIYMGGGKWNTFVPVSYWMPYPNPPAVTSDVVVEVSAPTEAPKKKRGRPKKV